MWTTLLNRLARTVPPMSALERLKRWPDPRAAVEAMPLIMDVGMNDGRDTLFYLKKGFRVVAVEASPVLVARARQALADYVARKQLVIEGVGIGEKEGILPFYVNLDNDHWSSFDRAWGTRNGTRYEVVEVKCVRPQHLFETYGMPYYLKIDIEGADIAVVQSLGDFRGRPRYISVEEHEATYFADLWAVGCRSFKLVNQRELFTARCPNPPLEGEYVDAAFDGYTSGPFGEEAPGEWLPLGETLDKYVTEIRSPTRGYLQGHSWFDIHGRIDNR